MSVIRKLPPELIREIAAGEVVSAPIDVLKELLENALDAGATRISVALEAGGIRRIRVQDNGIGISAEQLPLAADAHSTSKLDSLQDIRTLGFRGEGLHAIRHAARLTLTSRPSTQLGGVTLTAEGDFVETQPHPAPNGTIAEITGLFKRLPARYEALESPAAEGKRAVTLLSRYLLHHPHLQLGLEQDGEVRWRYAGGSFHEAAKFIWGPVTANRLLALEGNEDEVSVRGLVSRPELTRPRRDRLLLAVNGRPVEWDDTLLRAVLAPYRDLLPSGHFPVGILNLSVPPDAVLVNTTPDKTRVRFLHPVTVASTVDRVLSETLAGHPLAPSLPDFRTVQGVTAAPRHGFPALTFLATYRELYLLAEGASQLWVVDQHAAHERILYEALEQRYRSEGPAELPHAELLPLTPEDEATYLERQDDLAQKGLVLEPFGGGRWRVRRVPAFLLGHPELIAGVVSDALGRSSADEAWRAVLGRLACLPALKAGHELAHAEAQTLLDALSRCGTPWACPHGRPTALVLSELELARKFGRRGVRAAPPKVGEVEVS